MRGRLLNLLTLTSLLLAASLVAGWLRDRDQLIFTAGGSLCSVSCGGGSVFADMTLHWPQAMSPRWVNDKSGARGWANTWTKNWNRRFAAPPR